MACGPDVHKLRRVERGGISGRYRVKVVGRSGLRGSARKRPARCKRDTAKRHETVNQTLSPIPENSIDRAIATVADIAPRQRELRIPMVPAGGGVDGKHPIIKYRGILHGNRWPTDDEIALCIQEQAMLGVCGAPADGLVVFDFERRELGERFLTALAERYPELAAALYVQLTRRGLHVFIRTDAGNSIPQTDLAKDESGKLIIELRANLCIVMLSPSTIYNRERGERFTYSVLQGSIGAIPVATDEQFQFMLALARGSNLYVEAPKPPPIPRPAATIPLDVPMTERVHRFKRYIDKMPEAVSGRKGSKAAFK